MSTAASQSQQQALLEVVRQFALPGPVIESSVLARGHIHDSYVVSCDTAGTTTRFLFQRINDQVFRDPDALMRNVERVVEHLTVPGDRAVCLRLLPTTANKFLHYDVRGAPWRAFHFIEQSRSFDSVDTEQQAFDLGQAFGGFHRRLRGLDVDRLVETIPAFHDTARRHRKLVEAAGADRLSRVDRVACELETVETHRALIGPLDAAVDAGQIPVRVAHNDAKLDNVLFDDTTGDPLCVIDLDTVMPGLAIHDFGDLVRTASGAFKEDDTNLDNVAVDMALFKALARGYLTESHVFLTACEIRNMVFAAKLITFETGMRFLTDYLDGDRYFHVSREDHNLDRCRVQFQFLMSIERNEEGMNDIVHAAVKEVS